MTGKVDLTEHRDFGQRSSSHIVIPQYRANGIFVDIDHPMTQEEYDRVKAHERVFGRKNHYSEAHVVFDWRRTSERHFDYICHMCGKKLAVPWKGSVGRWDSIGWYSNMCHDCEMKVMSPFNSTRVARSMDPKEELFSLR